MANLLLISNDAERILAQVGQAFPSPAHRVAIERTGAEGFNCAVDLRPDVILLELQPDQSGLVVLRRLREVDARIPVVLITVIRSADLAIEAMRQGAYDYLLKPSPIGRSSATSRRCWTPANCGPSWAPCFHSLKRRRRTRVNRCAIVVPARQSSR